MNSKLIKGILLGVAALLVCGFAVYAIFFVKRGMVETDDGTYYYDFLGRAQTGMQTMPDKTVRYFDPETAKMAVGETVIDGSNYLFDGDGVMMYGHQQVNSVSKYFDLKTGKMLTGWIDAEEGRYYSDDKGVCASGLKEIEGKTYFFDKKSGLMVKGTVQDGDDTYGFDEKTGVALDGIVESDDGTKHGCTAGKMLKNCRAYENKHLYYFDDEGKVCREIDGNKKMVALTYDDGPSTYTDTILDVYKEHGQKATFFVVGERLSWNDSQAKREVEEGHQVGNHTYGHNVLSKLKDEKIKEEQRQINQQSQETVELHSAETQKTAMDTVLGFNQSTSSQASHVETMLVQMLVRYGDRVITIIAPDRSEISLPLAQYVGLDLGSDQLRFHDDRYNQILNEALQHVGEENFKSESYFLQHPDLKISGLAAKLCVDKVQISKSLKPEPTEEQIRNNVLRLVLNFRCEFMENRLKNLKNHRNYYYGAVPSNEYPGDLDIVIFDKATNLEVARY